MANRSVTESIAQALSAIVLLALLTTGLALMTLSSSLSDAEAMNLAGSLRMQSYRLAWDSQRDPHHLEHHLQQYQHTLNRPALRSLRRPWVPHNVTHRYQHLLDAWPALQAQLRHGDVSAYQRQVADYVGEIDGFVSALQHYAEMKMQLVAGSSLLGVIAIVALALMTIRFTHQQVVRPLNALVSASHAVKKGHFAFTPVEVEQDNELRVLAQAFSDMAVRLHSQYQQLESRVQARTEDLREANRTLALLYECSQMLTARPPEPARFADMLEHVRQQEHLRAVKLVCDEVPLTVGEGDHSLPWQHLPLQQDERLNGELCWQSSQGQPHSTLMQSLANMLSRAICIWQAQQQQQQMLLTEERATIARELHDSLAQALTFLRIQVTLLRRHTHHENQAAQAVINELDRALAGACLQLRDLLTTFRLSIDQASLVAAMQAMIAPLQEQTTAQIHFDYQPGLPPLEAQQQVHVLQIAREALLNAIRHAHASTISVDYQCCENGEHLLTVRDDGTGITSTEEPPGHYGLTIMTERAERLAGKLTLVALDKGTEVALRFHPTRSE